MNSKVLRSGDRPKPPSAGKGRVKGVPNKNTALLKDALLIAATEAGGKEGLVGYLKMRALDTPGPFLALLGKVLPMQVTGEGDGPVRMVVEWASSKE
jgi:hypothetical protein